MNHRGVSYAGGSKAIPSVDPFAQCSFLRCVPWLGGEGSPSTFGCLVDLAFHKWHSDALGGRGWGGAFSRIGDGRPAGSSDFCSPFWKGAVSSQ